MTHLRRATQSAKAIPAEKWRQKIGKLVIAVGLLALIKYVALPEKWSPSLIIALAVAIGYCVSSDFMRMLVRFLVAAIRDVLAAIKNGKANESS